MPGRRHVMDGIGRRYEKAVDTLMSPLASMVSVPREEDFGIDFYCQPKISIGARVETVTELAAIQVKGGDETLSYGGVDERGDWRKHEFAWLTSLAVPLYLAQVSRDCRIVELFSLAPLWRLFIGQNLYPFEVTFSTQPASKANGWTEMPPTRRPGENWGDGQRSTLDLGPPILGLSVDDPNDDDFRRNMVKVLRTWIGQDRLNQMRFLQSIPALAAFTGWRTSSIEGMGSRVWQYWSAEPGANLERLCQTAEPLLVNLGIHLKSQNDHGAYAFIPILKWLSERHQLGGIGAGLLEQLVRTHGKGLGPAEPEGSAQSGVEVSPSPENDETETT